MDKEQMMSIVKSGMAPQSCNTCLFKVTRMERGDDIIYFVERQYCRIVEEYLDIRHGQEICEVEDFVKKLLEVV